MNDKVDIAYTTTKNKLPTFMREVDLSAKQCEQMFTS